MKDTLRTYTCRSCRYVTRKLDKKEADLFIINCKNVLESILMVMSRYDSSGELSVVCFQSNSGG